MGPVRSLTASERTSSAASMTADWDSDASDSPGDAREPPSRKRELESDAFVSGRYKPRRKPARSAAHELRDLREDAAQMEAQMLALCAKWREALPDAGVRMRALEATKARWVAAQTEGVNRELKDQLLQQQLFLAAVQRQVTDSPLLAASRSKEMFDALHSPVELMAELSTIERTERLNAQCELGVRVAPAVLDRFTRRHAEHVTPASPFSHTSIMADEHFTFVSNVLVCKIPHATLDVAVDAAMSYFRNVPEEMSRRLVSECRLQRLQDLDGLRGYSRLHYRYGPLFVANSNTTLSAHVGADRAVIVIDFVDRDDLHPTATRPGDLIRDSCLVMMLTQARDAMSGQPLVLLQRINAIRYNLPPHAPLLHDEVKATLPFLNGDLFMEVVCHRIDQSLRRLPST